VSPDGSRVFVQGESQNSSPSRDLDYATVADDAATGAPLWLQRYDAPGKERCWPPASGEPDGSRAL